MTSAGDDLHKNNKTRTHQREVGLLLGKMVSPKLLKRGLTKSLSMEESKLTRRTSVASDEFLKMKKSTTFDQRCQDLLLEIPKGKVTTYKELAHALGSKAYRAVGQAMGRNQKLVEVPCHRVVRSNGETGKYAWGPEVKIRLLLEEGVRVEKGKIIHLDRIIHRFSD